MSEYDDQLTIRQQRSALANMEQTINDLRREIAAAVERERKLCDAARQARHVLIEAEFPDDRWMVTLLTDALAAAQPASDPENNNG